MNKFGVFFLPVLLLIGLSGCGNSGGLSPEDQKLDFGSNGISILVGVDANDPTKALISGSMRIEDNRMIPGHSEPGAVVIVGVDRWNLDGKQFEYGHILLRNSKKELIVAPPGLEITIPDEEDILGYILPAGKFTIPDNSKLPLPEESTQ